MKTKKRHLRPWIERIIEGVTFILIVGFAMLEDFEMQAIPWIIGAMALICTNTYVLHKYGKGW